MNQQLLKARAYDHLRKLLGYVENGTDTPVSISQDDATRDFIVRVGSDNLSSRSQTFTGTSLPAALKEAADAISDD